MTLNIFNIVRNIYTIKSAMGTNSSTPITYIISFILLSVALTLVSATW